MTAGRDNEEVPLCEYATPGATGIFASLNLTLILSQRERHRGKRGLSTYRGGLEAAKNGSVGITGTYGRRKIFSLFFGATTESTDDTEPREAGHPRIDQTPRLI